MIMFKYKTFKENVPKYNQSQNQFNKDKLKTIASIVKLSATLMAYSYNWSRKLNQLWHNIRWTTIA